MMKRGTERLWLNNSESPEDAQPLFNLKPPVSDANPGWGGGTYLHWDDASVDPDQPPGLQIQGVLYLADTPVNGGGIRVVPGFHKRLVSTQATRRCLWFLDVLFTTGCLWLQAESADLAREWHERRQLLPDNGPGGSMDLAELEGLAVVQLAAKAGDLIVWNSQLPHGTGKNTADEPRRAMFVSMTPVERVVAEDERGRSESELRADRTQAWRDEDALGGLSGLGKRLLGLEEW